jgi:hypothetical protein
MVASMSEGYVIFDGYNSWMNNGDEVDGPGVNEPVWPVLFDTFVAMTPLIISSSMMEAFEGCADIVVPVGSDTITIPYQPDTVTITGFR